MINVYAQIFGAGAVICMFLSYLKTTKKKYLFMQIVCNIFFTIQFFLVGGLSASGVCLITIVKSFAFYSYERKDKDIPLWLLILFEAITIAWGIYIFTDLNSILPIIVSIVYTYGTWQKNLKLTYLIGTFAAIVWIIYDFIVGAYVATIGSFSELVASLIGIYKLTMIKKETKEVNEGNNI